MKKILGIILLAIMLLSCIAMTGCDGDDDCSVCGGSGYYQKKDCPFC